MYKPKEAKLFGAALKQLLREKNLSDRQFAKQAGLQQSYVSKLLNPKPGNEIAEPRKKTRQQLAQGLGITEQELLEQIDRYSDSAAGKTIFASPGLAKSEEAIAKPPQESVESKAGSGENLMSLATKMFEQLGFNQKFKINRAFQDVGYQLKNYEKKANSHQLILSQRKDGICISIRQDILDPHLLNLKYWKYTFVLGEADLFTKARLLVLPSKKDIFLNSLHRNYWNSLQAEKKTVGDFQLNTCYWEYDDPPMCVAAPSLLLDEFNLDTLSESDTYLVVNYDKLSPENWQVCINSSEVLQEFISYFTKKLIEI
ncbi:MAG: helix-turn-helix domain-containing protein [Symplocastrum torsivum CPER-KK1]|jgi:transcriptional regulator with XRE-family HTH domain|uniref:Helix-turn-helix domain-containing protein n=1 Tax=Symplocastrum torsivum CPER-KK1 TaxID=450513 RepID=A0A951UCC3_9CYAN|nr:helix-turn-helix domain-containing protein [Symplocastrum torsivum CPER-KK1]